MVEGFIDGSDVQLLSLLGERLQALGGFLKSGEQLLSVLTQFTQLGVRHLAGGFLEQFL
jgi:hypothetical protein